MRLDRNAILAANDTLPELTEVEVPEWGGSVLVRVMSGEDRERFEAALSKGNDTNLRARLAAACLCDEAGKLLFTEADVKALGAKSSKALHRVYDVAVKLNAIGKAEVEELEKNSASAT